MVPFCNRIAQNRFTHDEKIYLLKPNTDSDLHRLHGDGWLSDWSIAELSDKHALLIMKYDEPSGSPFCYVGKQRIQLEEDRLIFELTVINQGKYPLPFGLGLHPYISMSPNTVFQAAAKSLWEQNTDYLPTKQVSLPVALDFNQPKNLPDLWTNAGFEGWHGEANVVWPERQMAMTISASENCSRYLLFLPDSSFDPSYRRDYFCFEPMTHCVNGHNLADGGGVMVLSAGESLTLKVAFSPTRF